MTQMFIENEIVKFTKSMFILIYDSNIFYFVPGKSSQASFQE